MSASGQRGRPAGAKRVAFSAYASTQDRFTMGQVASNLGWPLRDANDMIHRALSRGDLQQVGMISQPGCKRPVAVYARLDDLPAHTLMHALAGWR